MGYRIDFALRGATLQAVVSGRASLALAAGIARDIAEQASLHAADRLLIDLRPLADRVGTLGVLLVPATRPVSRVAVLDDQENDPYYAFPEDAARRRGRRLRCFCDARSALDWLGE